MYSSDLATTAAGYAAACELGGYENDAEYAESIGVDYFLISPNEDIYIYIYHFDSGGIVTAEFEFNPTLTVENLTAFLTRYGYATTGVEDFVALVLASNPSTRYNESSSDGYLVAFFNIDPSLLDAAKAWASGLGLTETLLKEGYLRYKDSSYHWVDIIDTGKGYVQIAIWEP